MKKIHLLYFGVLALSVLLLCSCSFNAMSVADVMRPPSVTGNKAGIHECLNESTGGYTLKYPKSGEYRTAIIMKDLNFDGTEECVALYKPQNTASGICVSILSLDSDKWKIDSSFTDTSFEADRVLFADLNGDGCDDVIVGWGNYGVLPSKISAYVNIEGTYRETSVEQPYNECICGRFTDSKFDNIMLFTLGSSDTAAKASLITMNDQKSEIKLASDTEINSEVVSFDSIIYSHITKDKYGAVAEGILADGRRLTQILYCEGKSTIHLFSGGGTKLLRNENICCADIDLDGIIEIPVKSELKTGEDEKKSDTADFIEWNVLNTDKEKLISKSYAVCDFENRYMYTADETFSENFTVRKSDNGELMFYKWDSKTYVPKTGELLFTIKVFNEQQWSLDSEGYSQLISENGMCYAYKIENDSGITADEIKEHFILI